MRAAGWMIVVAVAVLTAAGGTMSALAGDGGAPASPATTNAVKHQTLCPVMGGKVNTNLYADAEGKRVYFCCGGCRPEFKKNAAKYIKKMESEGITLDQTPPAATNAPAATPTPAQETDKGNAP